MTKCQVISIARSGHCGHRTHGSGRTADMDLYGMLIRVIPISIETATALSRLYATGIFEISEANPAERRRQQ